MPQRFLPREPPSTSKSLREPVWQALQRTFRWKPRRLGAGQAPMDPRRRAVLSVISVTRLTLELTI